MLNYTEYIWFQWNLWQDMVLVLLDMVLVLVDMGLVCGYGYGKFNVSMQPIWCIYQPFSNVWLVVCAAHVVCFGVVCCGMVLCGVLCCGVILCGMVFVWCAAHMVQYLSALLLWNLAEGFEHLLPASISSPPTGDGKPEQSPMGVNWIQL